MNQITVNKAKQVYYVTDPKVAGLTDLIMTVKNPNGTVLSSVAMEEYANGIYTLGFIPPVLGDYEVTITSVVNGDDITRVYTAVAYDVIDAVNKINIVDGKVDALVIKGDEIKAVVDANGVKLAAVVLKADEIKTVVDANSNKLISIETKIDALPTSSTRRGYFA